MNLVQFEKISKKLSPLALLTFLAACGKVAPQIVDFNKEFSDSQVKPVKKSYGLFYQKKFKDVVEYQKIFRPDTAQISKAIQEALPTESSLRGTKTYLAHLHWDSTVTETELKEISFLNNLNNKEDEQRLFDYSQKLSIVASHVKEKEFDIAQKEIKVCEWMSIRSEVTGIHVYFKSTPALVENCKAETQAILENLSNSNLLRYEYMSFSSQSSERLGKDVLLNEMSKERTMLKRKSYRIPTKTLALVYKAADIAHHPNPNFELYLDKEASLSPLTLRLNGIHSAKDRASWTQRVYDPVRGAVGGVAASLALLPLEGMLQGLGAKPEKGNALVLQPFSF